MILVKFQDAHQILQSWPLKMGHLTLPTPLNQCCNQTWYAMLFARRVHSNTTLKGGEGKMEIEYLKENKIITELCTSVPTIFVQDCSFCRLISSTLQGKQLIKMMAE